MEEKLDELSALLGDGVITRPGLEFFRDAFCAASFARIRAADQVRLVFPDERPDFEIKLGSQVEAFEVTEADIPGRRRDADYKHQPAGQAIPFPVDAWLTPELAFSILEESAKRKSDGRYDRSCRLLIYLNPTEFGIHQTAIEQAMKPATKAAAGFFSDVWILWKGKAYRTWQGSAARSQDFLYGDDGVPI